MAGLTVQQLKSMNLGYLTGNDLLRWCAFAHLNTQININPDSLMDGCNTAYKEVRNKLSNRYDITDELKNNGIINALGTVTQAAGAINGITLTNPGIGYLTAPSVTIVDPTGIGATAVATLSGSSVFNLAITAPGAGYTSPTLAITGGLGTDMRESVLVKITAIWAIRNILGNYEHVSKELENNFNWADQEVLDIRNAQANLEIDAAARCQASTARLVRARFKTLG